jgi:hypothetical protein
LKKSYWYQWWLHLMHNTTNAKESFSWNSL